MSSFKSLIVRFLTLTIALTSTMSQGACLNSSVWEIDFTNPKEARKKAIWFPTDKLNINKQGLGWDAGAAESRPGEIQTKPIALGHSWRTPSSIYVRVTILPPPKAILLNDGSMSTPYPGNMFVRYSPDLKNWSSWTILEHSYQKSTDRKKRNKRCYEGRIGIPQRNRNEYYKLLHNYSKLNVPWKSDEEAAVRWILKQQPNFFSKNIPFIGYVEFLFESNFYGGQRIKSFEAEISYCIRGRYIPPKNTGIDNERSAIPWRFKASDKSVERNDVYVTLKGKLSSSSAPYLMSHPLVCVKNGDYPDGSEMILIKQLKPSQMVHVVFLKSMEVPKNLKKQVTLQGHYQKIQNKKPDTSKTVHKKIPDNYKYFVVKSWEYQK